MENVTFLVINGQFEINANCGIYFKEFHTYTKFERNILSKCLCDVEIYELSGLIVGNNVVRLT